MTRAQGKRTELTMNIGNRLQELRQARGLSQGDIEHRTELPRTFISRIENGHVVPTIQTLEKLARGLKTPLWQLSTETKARPPTSHLPDG